MDPSTLALILGGANTLGGLLGGLANQNQTQDSMTIEQMLGGKGLDIQSAAVGDTLRRQLESMPVRDRTLFQLQNRLGQSPQQFTPSSIFNGAGLAQQGQGAQRGGVDLNALNTANQGYTPGAGGTQPGSAQLMMAKLGYLPTGTTMPNGNQWQQQLNQNYAAPVSNMIGTGAYGNPSAWTVYSTGKGGAGGGVNSTSASSASQAAQQQYANTNPTGNNTGPSTGNTPSGAGSNAGGGVTIDPNTGFPQPSMAKRVQGGMGY